MSEEDQNQPVADPKQELQDLEASVRALNKRLKPLQEQVVVAEELCQRFTNVKELLDNGDDGLEINLEWSKTKRGEMDALKTSADGVLVEIRGNLDAATTKVVEINNFFDQTFVPIRDKIQDGETGLDAQYTAAKAQREQIDALKLQADALLVQIQTDLESIKKRVEEMNAFFDTTFTELKDKVMNEEDGLGATLAYVEDVKKKILVTQKSASNTLLEVQQFRDQSKLLQGEAKKDRDEIETMKTESDSFKKSIGEILQLVTDSSLNNAFLERKKELKKEVNVWMGVLMGSLGVLLIILATIYYLQTSGKDELEPVDQLIRYLYTTPILILLFEAIHNYGNARDLLEKYSFKAVMSTTLSSYIKLLKEGYKDVNEDALQSFAMKRIDAIFKEPYGNHSRKKKFTLKPNDGVLDFEDSEDYQYMIKPEQGEQRSLKKEVTGTETTVLSG